MYIFFFQKYPDLIKFTKPKTTGGPTSDADRQFVHLTGKTPDEFINVSQWNILIKNFMLVFVSEFILKLEKKNIDPQC